MSELIITAAACLFSVALFAWHLRRVARIDREYREQAQAMRDQHAREYLEARSQYAVQALAATSASVVLRRLVRESVELLNDPAHRGRRLEGKKYEAWKAKRADITERAKGVEW